MWIFLPEQAQAPARGNQNQNANKNQANLCLPSKWTKSADKYLALKPAQVQAAEPTLVQSLTKM